MDKNSKYLIIDSPEEVYDESFQSPIDLPFKIDLFQQQAAKAINQEHNALLSCATGSGKTVPCLFAINYYLKKGKRVIYTSPVKSLSNQKYKEFSEKIPDVGIMTGDIKCNPDAQCVILTTEILRNMLYKQSGTSTTSGTFTKSEVGINVSSFLSNVGCVIFDEIHYINDKDRGKNWEESIVMLPKHIRILGLSGTINEPERFASWIGDIKETPIHLIRTLKRPIPLNHYIYIDNLVTESKLKDLKEKEQKEKETGEVKSEYKNGMMQVMHGDLFISRNYEQALSIYQNKSVDPITKKPTKVGNPRYAKCQSPGELNVFLDFLKKGRYLPSLIFVLSRRKVEEYAAEVQITLVDYEQRAEILKLFDMNMSKFCEKYSELNQYAQVRSLLSKGIGIHHSGLIPVLKEVVEILFSKGLIKLLFATETFAIGVNMPTKTVVFTELSKPDGLGNTRLLKTDEYLQMSGRAGRRGLDSTGTVIHFPMKDLPRMGEAHMMMTGYTPAIVSKFCPGYQFILKCLVNNKNLDEILNSSLRVRQDKVHSNNMNNEKQKKQLEYEKLQNSFKSKYGESAMKDAENYHKLWLKTQPQVIGDIVMKPAKDKALDKKIADLGKKVSKGCYNDYKQILTMNGQIALLTSTNLDQNTDGLSPSPSPSSSKDETLLRLKPVFDFLTNLHYLENNNPTLKGIIASEINDCNCLLVTEMIMQGFFDELTGPEMFALLAIFIEEKSEDDENVDKKGELTSNLRKMVERVFYMRDDLEKQEEDQILKYGIELDTDWAIFLDFVDVAYMWASGSEIAEIYAVTNMYEGNFVKNMLRLQNIAESTITILSSIEKHDLANKLTEISKSVIRGIVTNNSLYVAT